MMVLIILCILLNHADSLLVSDTDAMDGRNEESGTRANRAMPSSIKPVTLPTRKCVNFIFNSEESEEEECTIFCKGLKKGFTYGKCLEGTCRCKFDATAVVIATEEKTRDLDKAKKERGRQGVKCKNLIRFRGQMGSENHKGCGIHCRLLGSDNKDGHCIEGVCKCSKETLEQKRIVQEEEEEKDSKCTNDEDCEFGCNGSNRESRCMSGVCRCKIIPQKQDPFEIPRIDREVKKCEHRRRAVSNEICRSHCEDFSKDHREGRCMAGVCHCGYAVFEVTETEINEEYGKNSRKMNGSSRGRIKRQFQISGLPQLRY